MRKPTIFVMFIVATIVFLSIIQIVVSNSLSTTGIELDSLDDKIKSYRKENSLLEEKLLQASSLTTIDSKAKILGFTEVKSEMVLTAPFTFALKR